MSCFAPIRAFYTVDNAVVFSERGNDITRVLRLPCGRCNGCRLERSRQWALRCYHEASLYKHNCFVTLTYSDDHYPSAGSLDYDDFQRFMKRLRKSNFGKSPGVRGDYPIRFYMCGEYGSKNMRPHWHVCLFNFDFEDKQVWQRTASKELIYRSKELERLWPFGYSSIGELTFQSAAYVARYVLKKVTGDFADDHYTRVNEFTGEIIKLRPEFNRMSLKPGIGSDWYDKFSGDVHKHDYAVINGKKMRVPRYYDNRLKLYDIDQYEELKAKRQLFVVSKSDDELLSTSLITDQRISKLKRNLD